MTGIDPRQMQVGEGYSRQGKHIHVHGHSHDNGSATIKHQQSSLLNY